MVFLKGLVFMRLWIKTISKSFYLNEYCLLSCFLAKILAYAFLSCEALSYPLNRQTMDFKLPHDVVCACAKRDEPPSRRRPVRASLAYGLLLMAKGLTDNPISHWPSALSTAFGGYRPTSARHSVSSVYSVDCPKFVFIRTTIVHFLVFSRRFSPWTSSFRTTSFAAAQRMTTAEQTEAYPIPP